MGIAGTIANILQHAGPPSWQTGGVKPPAGQTSGQWAWFAALPLPGQVGRMTTVETPGKGFAFHENANTGENAHNMFLALVPGWTVSVYSDTGAQWRDLKITSVDSSEANSGGLWKFYGTVNDGATPPIGPAEPTMVDCFFKDETGAVKKPADFP